MHIRRLEIVGFKSFPERVRVPLNPGLSAVVGPNGCGKSNIIDAVRWVMGEQSSKALRGRNMDDVLFNGSQNRPASALAEATLILTREADPAAGFPEAAETSVARRLYRNGDSEYLLNRVPCRLKDIVRFFTDQGIGTRAYSIIEQGRIGWLVDARPEDRRGLIDEAAGITRYKQQKKEAERKILSASANLENVRLIKAETKKQLGQIARAAAQAARFRALKAELRDLDLALSARTLTETRERRNLAEVERDEDRRLLTALLADQNRQEVEMETLRLKLEQAEKEADERSRAWHGQLAARDLTRQEAEHAAADLAQAERRRGETLEELARLAALADRHRAEEGRLTSAREILAGEDRAAAAGAETQRARWRADREALETLNQEFDQAERLRTTEERAAATLAEKLAGSESLLAHHAGRQDLLAAEAARAEEAASAKAEARAAAAETETAAWAGLKAAEEAAGQRETARRRAEENSAGRQKLAAAAEAGLAALRARLEALKGIRDNFGWYPAGIKALLAAPELRAAGLLGPVAEFLKIPDGFEAAAEAGLGERLAWLLVRDRAAALTALDYAEERRLGRQGFLCQDELGDLGRALLGDFQLAERLPENNGAPVLTRDGRYAGRGLVAGGRPAAGGADEAGLLARLKEVETLAGREKLESAAATAVKAEAAAAAAAALAAAAEAAEAAEAALTARGRLAAAEREASLTAQAAEQAESRRRELAAEAAETDRRIAELTRTLTEGRLRRAETEERAKAAGSRADELRAKRGEAARILEESRLAGEAAVAKAAAAAEKFSRADRELELGRQSLAETERGLRARTAEAAALAGQMEELKVKTRLLGQELEAWPEKLNLGEAAWHEARRRLAEIKENFQTREMKTRDLRRRREELLGLLSGRETELARLEMSLERLAEDLRRDWRVAMPEPPAPSLGEPGSGEPGSDAPSSDEPGSGAPGSGQPALDETASPEPAPAPPGLEILNPRDWAGRELPEGAAVRREALRAKIESLGEVSLGAIERETELKAEYERYQTQYDDLSRALADLRNGIERINRACRQLFGETFKAVDEKFREIFPILFEGGQGWLSLTDESDPLESGVEIHVHPPGKKLLTMSLLSGGEKALTALALIFALYLIKPSPFCLLDEIDAPLDEANIDRFNRLLQNLSRNSQIIMVTHNKRTMQICRTLYGVTMETPGVSRLVSVNLAEAEALADA